MNWDYYKKYIISTNTIIRTDISPLFENPEVFQNLVDDLIKPFSKEKFDKIVCLDALGFILGSAIAYKLGKPLILIRKEDKFPYNKKELVSEHFIDYTKTEKSFEIKKNSISKGDRVLIIDEWIDTGTQIKAAIKLIERLGGIVIGISVIYARLTKNLEEITKKYNIKSFRISK